MQRSEAVKNCVGTIYQHNKRKMWAIHVDTFRASTTFSDGSWWDEGVGFHKEVKDRVFEKHNIVIVYCYERPGFWAINPTPEVEQIALYRRIVSGEAEYEDYKTSNPEFKKTATYLAEMMKLHARWVAFPDYDREDDRVLNYIDGLEA